MEPNSPDSADVSGSGSQFRWPDLLDTLPQFTTLIDASGRVVHVNRSWKAWGRPTGNGLPFVPAGEDFLTSCRQSAEEGHDALAKIAAMVERVLEDGDIAFEGRVAASGPGGAPGLILRIGRVVDDAGALLLTLVEDAPRPADIRRLEEVENGYRTLYEESPIGLFSCRPDGRYLSANPSFLRMLGYDSEQQLRTSGTSLTRGSESRPLFRFDGLLPSTGAGGDREIELERSDGRPIVLRLWLRPILRDDGDLERVEGAAGDITERRVLEGKLLESQKLEAIGQLAGGVAHDFNNVLTVVLAEAQLALHAIEAGRTPREHLEDIETAARGGSRVTRQLLMFARRDRNEPAAVELGQAIMGVQRMISRLLGEQVSVSLDLEPEPLHVVIDPGRLDQALINLAVNARDAMPDGGTLTFRTRGLGGARRSAEVVVVDTGTGMSDEVRERAFEPFFTTKARGEGTGIGLAAVYGMVQEANGTVEIESTQGHGTSIRILLPLHDPPTHSETAPAPFESPIRSTVLLVEDADDVRGSTSRLLKGAGMSVMQAGSASEALAILDHAAEPVDLLIVDVGLPDVSGPRLVARARETWPGVPAIFISGYPERVSSVDAHSGARHDLLLPKPFTFDQLAHAIVTVLSAASAIR